MNGLDVDEAVDFCSVECLFDTCQVLLCDALTNK